MNQKAERAAILASLPIPQLLLKFSIPAIIGMLVNAIYNVVDRIFLGRAVNPLAIGGVYLTFPIMLATLAFSMLIGIGGNSLSSIRLGEKKRDEAERILGNAFSLLLITSLILSISIYIFIEPLLRFFGASDTILPYSLGYIKIILLGVPIQMLGFGLNNFIRGEGNPIIAMGSMLIGAVVNTILDYLFVIVIPWGVQGAALATIIGQLVSGIWVIYYFLSKRALLKLKRSTLGLHLSLVKRILLLGTAPFVMQLGASLVTILFNNQLQRYGGDIATSSMGVINSIATLAFMPIFGLNQGCQPILGFNYGARQLTRVKEALKLAVLAATTYMALIFLLVQTFPGLFIRIFISNPNDLANLLPVAVPALRIYFGVLPLIGFQIIAANYFQATGKPKVGIFLSTSRQFLFLVPALLLMPYLFQLTGVWMSAPASDLLASLTTGYFIIRDMKLLNYYIQHQDSFQIKV